MPRYKKIPFPTKLYVRMDEENDEQYPIAYEVAADALDGQTEVTLGEYVLKSKVIARQNVEIIEDE